MDLDIQLGLNDSQIFANFFKIFVRILIKRIKARLKLKVFTLIYKF